MGCFDDWLPARRLMELFGAAGLKELHVRNLIEWRGPPVGAARRDGCDVTVPGSEGRIIPATPRGRADLVRQALEECARISTACNSVLHLSGADRSAPISPDLLAELIRHLVRTVEIQQRDLVVAAELRPPAPILLEAPRKVGALDACKCWAESGT